MGRGAGEKKVTDLFWDTRVRKGSALVIHTADCGGPYTKERDIPEGLASTRDKTRVEENCEKEGAAKRNHCLLTTACTPHTTQECRTVKSSLEKGRKVVDLFVGGFFGFSLPEFILIDNKLS